MDSKKKNPLSNVFGKLGGGTDNPYEVSDDSWASLQNDEDIDVLRLDDSVPAPEKKEENRVELTLENSFPVEDDKTETPAENDESVQAWKPVMQTKPELTLEPELEVKPELTLEPELNSEPDDVLTPEPEAAQGSAAGTGTVPGTAGAAGQPSVNASGSGHPGTMAQPEFTENGLEIHYSRPERPAQAAPEEEFAEESPEKPKRRWKFPGFSAFPNLPFGGKKKQEEEYPEEEFREEEVPEDGIPEEPAGAGTGMSGMEEPAGAGSAIPGMEGPAGTGTAAPAGTGQEIPAEGQLPDGEDLPEDEDYEFDDQGTGAVKAILGSAGTMAAGIGAGLLGILKVIGRFMKDAFLAAFTAIGAYLQHELRPKNLRNLFSRYLLAFIIIYYELVLKFSTTKKPLGFSLLYMVLFSICWGLVGYLLTTILRPAQNRNARKVLIFILAVPYLVNYFRFRQAGEFLGLQDTMPVTAKSLFGVIFSLPGLAHIALYLFPFLLYTFVLCYADKAKRIKARRRIRTVGMILLLWFLTWLLVLANGNYRWAYSKEYNYGTAVSDFGLLNTMRLDVLMKIRGNTGRPADVAPPAALPADEDETEDETGTKETEETETDDGFVDPLDEQMEDDMDEEEDGGTEEEPEEPEGQPVVSN